MDQKRAPAVGKPAISFLARQLAASLAMFIVVLILTNFLLPAIYDASGLRSEAPDPGRRVGLLFQSLNEEILFRGLLIGIVTRHIKSPLLIAVSLAAIFSGAHFLLYRFPNPLHLSLSFSALATLFFAGLAMNNLFLLARHVGFSWAFHAGWNVMWLPTTIFDNTTGRQLHEPELFDRMLGTPQMLALSSTTAIVSAGLLLFRSYRAGRSK